MEGMFLGGKLSTGNYDALLNGWSLQILQDGVEFHGGDSKYSPGSQAARDILTSAPNNWIITDDGVTP
jgi:hypothetical protein